MHTLLDGSRTLAATLWQNVQQVLAYPFNPAERVFAPYLATSLVAAFAVYVARLGRANSSGGPLRGFLRFLFPSQVWQSPSAWLDVRYFFLHQIVRVSIYGAFASLVTSATFNAASGRLGSATEHAATGSGGWLLGAGYALASVAILDLVAYGLHYAQHHVPLLWEFHKVHHSARVMHPLTNYREHPVDNIAYAVGMSICSGLTMAVVFRALGYVPSEPTVLGASVFVVAFNAFGYHLRHSHIWLRWPDPLVYVFGCPAHHHVHHSYHPSHINRNFAFMFPVWDVLFGTFTVPRSNQDVKFGVGDEPEQELTSCLRLYWVPFRDAARRLRPARR